MFNKLSLKRSSTKFNLKNKNNNKKEENEIKQRNEYMKMMNKINNIEQTQSQSPGSFKRSESLLILKRTSSSIGNALYNTIDTISTPTKSCNNIMYCRSNSSISIIDKNNIKNNYNDHDDDIIYINNNYQNDLKINDNINSNQNQKNNINTTNNTKEFDKFNNAIFLSKIFNFYLF